MDLGDWRPEKGAQKSAQVRRWNGAKVRKPSKRWHLPSQYEPAVPVPRTHQSAAELKKTARLRAELERALREPLNPGGRLPETTRRRIRKRVAGGVIAQTWHLLPGRRRGPS